MPVFMLLPIKLRKQNDLGNNALMHGKREIFCFVFAQQPQ